MSPCHSEFERQPFWQSGSQKPEARTLCPRLLAENPESRVGHSVFVATHRRGAAGHASSSDWRSSSTRLRRAAASRSSLSLSRLRFRLFHQPGELPVLPLSVDISNIVCRFVSRIIMHPNRTSVRLIRSHHEETQTKRLCIEFFFVLFRFFCLENSTILKLRGETRQNPSYLENLSRTKLFSAFIALKFLWCLQHRIEHRVSSQGSACGAA